MRENKDQIFEIDKIKTKRKPKLVPSLGEIGSDHGERLVIEDIKLSTLERFANALGKELRLEIT